MLAQAIVHYFAPYSVLRNADTRSGVCRFPLGLRVWLQSILERNQLYNWWYTMELNINGIFRPDSVVQLLTVTIFIFQGHCCSLYNIDTSIYPCDQNRHTFDEKSRFFGNRAIKSAIKPPFHKKSAICVQTRKKRDYSEKFRQKSWISTIFLRFVSPINCEILSRFTRRLFLTCRNSQKTS